MDRQGAACQWKPRWSPPPQDAQCTPEISIVTPSPGCSVHIGDLDGHPLPRMLSAPQRSRWSPPPQDVQCTLEMWGPYQDEMMESQLLKSRAW